MTVIDRSYLDTSTMNLRTVLNSTFSFVAVLTSLFLFHRLMIKDYIGVDLTVGLLPQLSLYAIAFLSDVWISSLLAIPLVFWSSRKYLLTIYLFTSIGLAMHVPYVEFFRTSLRWVHVSYLIDLEFLRSSGSFLSRPRLWFSVLFAVTIFFLALKPLLNNITQQGTPASRPSKWNAFNAFIILLSMGIIANALSQKWTRTQNFSVKLTQNLLVQLALDAAAHNKTQKQVGYDERDLETLKAALQYSKASNKNSTLVNTTNTTRPIAQLLRNTATQTSTSTALEFVANALKSQFSEHVLKTENRHIIVVILESLRAAESRHLTPHSRGYTDQLDNLTAQGIGFTAGYSSSVVSRSGAESSVCNFISTIAINTMRDTPIEKSKCVRDLFQAQLQRRGINSTYAWHHGGHHGFDNQGLFYKTAGFEIPFDVLKMPKDLPRTDWGLSDRVLAKLSSVWLSQHDSQHASGLHFTAIVTASNHTAWTLPPDAEPQLFQFQKQSPSAHLATAKYTDTALGEWAEKLKKDGVWQKSVVVFVGDHGIQDFADGVGKIPGFGHGTEGDILTAEHLTRVYFSLSGGLVETALSRCQIAKLCGQKMRVDWPVSQIDILPTFANILPIEDSTPWFGVSLFQTRRLWPVFSDLGDFYFIPKHQRPLISKSTLHETKNLQELEPQWRNLRSYLNIYTTLVRQGKLAESIYGSAD